VVINNNTCPHRGAKLSMGKVSKNCIECPYHGWLFDDTGMVTEIPAIRNSNFNLNVSIESYESMETGGLVWFCPGKLSGYTPPIVPEMHCKEWTAITGYDTFNNDWLTSLENSIDITHVNFVHSDFGDKKSGEVKNIKIHEASDKINMKSCINHKSDNMWLKFSENPEVNVSHDILLPNTVSIQFSVNDLFQVITYVTYTPISEDETLLNWVFLRNLKIPVVDSILDHSFKVGMEKALSEDKAIVNSLSKLSNRINIGPDKVQQTFRAALKRMFMVEPTIKY
jgi:phenylpropionate dioxygenase-like ring-hydroxylating dioxygenase large terminal subunit